MNREEYLKLLKEENYHTICYNYYNEHNKKSNMTFDINIFYNYFKLFLHVSGSSPIEKCVRYYNSKYGIMVIMDKDNKVIGYN